MSERLPNVPTFVKKGAVVVAIGVAGYEILPKFGLDFSGKTRVANGEIHSKSKLDNISLPAAAILVEEEGTNVSTFDGTLEKSGLQGIAFNRIPENMRHLNSSVSQRGKLQLIMGAGGLQVKGNKATAHLDRLDTQVVGVGVDDSDNNDGILVRARGVVHPDEAQETKRIDVLKAFGRDQFSDDCGMYSHKSGVLGAAITKWVKVQRGLKDDPKLEITYVTDDSVVTNPETFRLPKKQNKSVQELTDTIFDDGDDGTKVKTGSEAIQSEGCDVSAKVVDKMKKWDAEQLGTKPVQPKI